MFSSQPAEISLDAPCRALAAVRADKIESRFLVGSCSLLRPRQQPPPTTRRSASNPGSAADAAANHLYLVRFHSEVNELGLEAKVPHDTGPVCKIVASPNDPSIVLTVPSGGTAATLWRIPRFLFDDNPVGRGGGAVDDDDSVSVSSYASSAPSQMEALTRLESSAGGSGSSSEIVDAAWRDPAEGGGAASFLEEPGSSSLSASSSDGGDVVTLERNGTVTRWDATAGVASSTRQAAGRDATSSSRSGFPPRLALDPHSSNGCALAVSRGHAVHIVDWRAETSVPTGTVDQFRAHPRSVVTSLDYNPNKPHVLATSGQDGLVKFFDLRAARHPLLVGRGGHSHWVWNVLYNPFHDQLVLSTGTDSVVNLWRVSSISSAPLLALADDAYDDDEIMAGDGGPVATRNLLPSSSEVSSPNNARVARHEHHGGDAAAVYGAAWGGGADPWIYATLGYDGRVALNHVPSQEKYKILL